MNSEQRREARYWRRKARREQIRKERLSQYDNFDKVFTYKNLYEAYRKCCNGVRWKSSVQSFISNAPSNVWRLYKSLHDGSYHSSGFYEFDICDRGKVRHIKSVRFSERVVQKCLCDNALVPILSNNLIYDNGACLKEKGYKFAISRLKTNLSRHYEKYKDDGYILLFDFKKYFDNVNHDIVHEIIEQSFDDHRIIDLTCHFVDSFGDIGIGLGSQVSQIIALRYASGLDHFIKEILQIKGYGRYMDDGYLLFEKKEDAKYALEKISNYCKSHGIILNKKKTQIIKLPHGFTWLKGKYRFDGSRIIKRISHTSIVRTRRKLKKLALMKIDIEPSFMSWRGYARQFNAARTIESMENWRNKCLILLNEVM